MRNILQLHGQERSLHELERLRRCASYYHGDPPASRNLKIRILLLHPIQEEEIKARQERVPCEDDGIYDESRHIARMRWEEPPKPEYRYAQEPEDYEDSQSNFLPPAEHIDKKSFFRMSIHYPMWPSTVRPLLHTKKRPLGRFSVLIRLRSYFEDRFIQPKRLNFV